MRTQGKLFQKDDVKEVVELPACEQLVVEVNEPEIVNEDEEEDYSYEEDDDDELQPETPYLGQQQKSESYASGMNETVMFKVMHQTEAPKKIEIIDKEEDWASEDEGFSKKQQVIVVQEPSLPVEQN